MRLSLFPRSAGRLSKAVWWRTIESENIRTAPNRRREGGGIHEGLAVHAVARSCLDHAIHSVGSQSFFKGSVSQYFQL
jgi:hypothetical protein